MWGEKVKFACKVFRTEHAQIPGYPLVKDHWYILILLLKGDPEKNIKGDRANFYFFKKFEYLIVALEGLIFFQKPVVYYLNIAIYCHKHCYISILVSNILQPVSYSI